MKEKLTLIFVLYAFLITPSNCIKIDDSENATTLCPMNSGENITISSEAQVTEKQEEQEDGDSQISLTTPSYIYKIPPTLHNAKSAEKNSDKNLINPTPASIHKNPQLIPEGKLKQAIINNKQQNFKNIIERSNKLKDQVRLETQPAEIKSEEKEESRQTPPPPPTPKEFIPSPELNNLYTSNENRLQDHFHPMNHYYRLPSQHDAQFPHENHHFNGQNPIIDTKWLGSSHPPLSDHHRHPHYVNQHAIRNTNVEFPHLHGERVNFPPHNFHQKPFAFPTRSGELTGERMVFPIDSSLNQEEFIRQVPALPTKIPGLQHLSERTKGTWKWIPESDEEVISFNPFSKFTQFDFQRHQPSRDRPYSFESSDIFTQHTTPSIRSSGSSETEEINTGRPAFSEEAEKLDIKLVRNPSPWKRIVHVMTAAIPIGLLISALTPRIVYVHPNASAPTIPPSFAHQLPPPIVNNQPPSSNNPTPLRQRALFNYDAEIDQFLKIMDTQYRERYRGINLDGKCEDRFFCEIALMGARPGASRMHKTLYYVALETPKEQARKSGLSEIFTAIQRQNCNVFNCKKA